MRIVNRIVIAITFLLSIWVIYLSVRVIGLDKTESVALFAAALAVISSVYSSWSAQRTLEMQEDELKPYPYPFFDITSRPGTYLFRVKNFGNTIAYDIKFKWDGGEPFILNLTSNEYDIKVLVPNDTISYNLAIDNLKENATQTFTGLVQFKDASGYALSHKFIVSLGQFGNAVKVDSSETYANMALQDMPQKLSDIEAAISVNLDQIKKLLEKYLKK